MENKKAKITIALGLLMSAFIQILQHYNLLTDLVYGGTMGISIGLIISAIVKSVNNKKKLLHQ